MDLERERRPLMPAAVVGFAMTIAGILWVGLGKDAALPPYMLVAAGLTLMVAGLFGMATAEVGSR